MNFVIFSKNFYPQNDAEAFCTTRFASALAEAGHVVHVVTVEYACDFDYKVLLDERVKITRVRVGRKMPIPFQVNLRPMMVLDRDMRSIAECCRAVKHVLREYERPILITRAMPLHSAVVGIRTHKYAYKWISHFSDPIPWFKIDNKLLQLKDWLTRRLIKKAIAQADAISVTCPLAIRYYKEAYASASVGKHFFVTTHIGDCKLDSKQDVTHETVFTRRVILHPGDMYFGRGDLIFKAVDALNELGEKCFFVLDRPPFPDMVHWFRESGNVISLGIRGGGH